MPTPKKKRHRSRTPQFAFVLDDADHDVLRRAAELEKLSKSDTLRRALREHYKRLQRNQLSPAS
jgi:hypothetical protein